jgi:caffeoyl-CoA O-methyltransferase
MHTLFEQVDAYISDLLAPEDEALQFVAQTLKENGIPDASVSPVQGKFLQVLAAACRAERILELGTLGAYSTIWLGRMLPPGGRIVSIESDEQHAGIARANIERAGLSDKTEVRTGKALDLLPQLAAENARPFDFVFIDADKPPYMEYFQWAIRLGRSGTIIVADNVIRNGNVLDPASSDEKVQGVRRLNAWLKECDAVTATILQNVGAKEYDGMVVAVVK